MSEPMLALRDVWFSYGGPPVLEAIDLTVEGRGYLAILGPNGGGKSTLLKVVLGLVKPSQGTVQVLGTTPSRAHGRVGYVPQFAKFDLGFPIDVLDLVLMGRLGARKMLRPFASKDRAVAMDMLERVEVAALAHRPIGSLSGGQLQRVLIARALALEPRLLLLDEPTASLDERVERSVWELFNDLAREMAVVLVTHDIGAISRYVDRVACLNRRLFSHPTEELSPEVLERTYGCPVDLLAHGHPHRVLEEHGGGNGGGGEE